MEALPSPGVDALPPLYTTIPVDSETHPTVVLNFAPIHDNVTFQQGLLGNGPASLEGDIQVKYAGADEASRPSFSSLEICFRGLERCAGVDDIELTEQRTVVWGVGAAGSSSVGASTSSDNSRLYADGSRGDFPPASTPFKLELTPDLPHCIHLGPSSLEYTLTATLTPSDPTLPTVTKSSPVHLVRSAPAGSLLAGIVLPMHLDPPPSITPEIMSAHDPIDLSVRLSRTVFRRSEPIELLARIEVPTANAVQELGLRLRTVGATLVRIVTAAGAGTHQPPGVDAKPPLRDLGSDDEDESSLPPPSPIPPRETVLTRSGKSARFSPTRPIIIRLLLHPPSSLSCESITQSTILHTISFEVRVTVGIYAQATSSRNDIVLSRTVFIIPDTPSPRSDKQREVETYAETSPPNWMPADGPVPTYHESANESITTPGEASGSWGALGGEEGTSAHGSGGEPTVARDLWDRSGGGGEEEEYDGYEELSASLSTRAPPPTIDADVSPPDASDPPPGVDDFAFGYPPPPSHSSAASSLHSASVRGLPFDDGPPLAEEEDEVATPGSLSLSHSLSSLRLASSDVASVHSGSPLAQPHTLGEDAIDLLPGEALPPPYAGAGAVRAVGYAAVGPNGAYTAVGVNGGYAAVGGSGGEEDEEDQVEQEEEVARGGGATLPPPYTQERHGVLAVLRDGQVFEIL